jgi:divalent metal cation (Fe/Co/Zn/Cd) transporter
VAANGLRLEASGPVKTRAAGLSIASNISLIALKVVAGAVTGSVAILTEALHSAIDLVASIVAWVSVRKADEPADAEHRYGHHKIENLSAAIEGMLILVGSSVIAFEGWSRASRSTSSGSASPSWRSRAWPTSVSRPTCTARPGRPSRPRSRVTRPTCAPTR